MENATEFVCREFKQKTVGQAAKYLAFTVLFIALAVIAVAGILLPFIDPTDGSDTLMIVGSALLLLFSLFMIFALRSPLVRAVRMYRDPLESDVIKNAAQAGVTCQDIYNTLHQPVEMILGVCIGEKCLAVVDDITKTFALTNVTEIYMTVHSTNLIEDKYGITIVDKSGEKILEWKHMEGFSRQENKLEVTLMISRLAGYCPNAKIGCSK